jgi:hypothetical protein
VDIFKVDDKVNESNVSRWFKILMEHRNDLKDTIQGWSEGFYDRDNKIIYEFQTTFHS